MSIISNYIEKYASSIFNIEEIEFYIWKYLLEHRIFTVEIIVSDYLQEKFGLYIQIVKRLNDDYNNYRNTKKELRSKFKMILDELRLGKMVRELKYSNKIFSVGDALD